MTKLLAENIKLLGLSKKEIAVLGAIYSGKNTPLLISESIKVSRPAVYEIIERLHKRGLVKSHIKNGRRYWSRAKERDLEESLYSVKKQLLNIEGGVEEVHGLSDSTVVVHRGREAVKKLLDNIVKNHKEQRLYAIQGDKVSTGWENIYTVEGMNEWNRSLKKNMIIAEMIFPKGVFERFTKLLGKKWAEDFEGRASITHEIDEKYFRHGGQIFIFKNSLYLMAMNEEIIIEVRNSEIQKLILSMFHFIQDNSKKFDVNERLRKLIAEEGEKE